jgi:hypothetical protein
MNSGDEKASEVFRQVVRGERPWTDLRGIGMIVELEGNRCQVENPQHVPASVDVYDLAKGLVAHLPDAQALREWAFVMEAIYADFNAEDHPVGDTVLTALWDASFGNPISPEVRATLEQVARTNGRAT